MSPINFPLASHFVPRRVLRRRQRVTLFRMLAAGIVLPALCVAAGLVLGALP
jgi:hypothetical protein